MNFGKAYQSNMAPEMFAGKYDEKCDVFSCGVVAFLILSGKLPFNGPTDDIIKRNTVNGVYDMQNWGHVSDEAQDFVKKLL